MHLLVPEGLKYRCLTSCLWTDHLEYEVRNLYYLLVYIMSVTDLIAHSNKISETIAQEKKYHLNRDMLSNLQREKKNNWKHIFSWNMF